MSARNQFQTTPSRSKQLLGSLLFYTREGAVGLRRGPIFRTDLPAIVRRIYATSHSHVGLKQGESLLERVEILLVSPGCITISLCNGHGSVYVGDDGQLCVGASSKAERFFMAMVDGRQTMITADGRRWKEGRDGKWRVGGDGVGIWCCFVSEGEKEEVRRRARNGVWEAAYEFAWWGDGGRRGLVGAA